MRQIIIDDELKKRAKNYAEKLFNNKRDDIFIKLEEIKNVYSSKGLVYEIYIKIIKEKYEFINGSPISDVKPKFAKLKVDLDEKMTVNGKTKTFSEHIIDAMNYKSLRTDAAQNGRYLLIDNFRTLKIKTCVYCNSQYAVSLDDNKTVGFDFDHVYPKSKYPYLSTNFFNLVPCCPVCNRTKSNVDYKVDFYVNEDPQTLFSYRLDINSIADYQLSRKNDDLVVEVCDKSEKGMANGLHLEAFCNQHKDVAEDVLIKAYKYTDSSLKGLMDTLGENFYRLWYGVYEDEYDVYRRPLSAMTNDIVNQIKEIVKAGNLQKYLTKTP